MPPNKFEVLKVYTRKDPIVMHNSITMPNMYSSCTVIYSENKATEEVPMMPNSFKQLFVSNNWHGLQIVRHPLKKTENLYLANLIHVDCDCSVLHILRHS